MTARHYLTRVVVLLVVSTVCMPIAWAAEKPVDPVARKYDAILAENTPEAVLAITKAVTPGVGQEELKTLCAALLKIPDGGAAVIRGLAEDGSPLAPGLAAELLWQTSLAGRLSEPTAELAGELLTHEDPFVGALAEWAIATKVGMENGGQTAAWPRADAPQWFDRWYGLDADFLLEADYVCLAIRWNIHHDGSKLLGSVGKIIERAGGAANEVLASKSTSAEIRATVMGNLSRLESIRKRLAREVDEAPQDIVNHRKLWIEARRAARPIVLANPAVDFQQLLFVKRHSAHSHRNITGSQYPWIHKPGGDIYIKTGLNPGDDVRPVIDEKLPPGHVHGMDLWWDGDRVVFGYAAQPDWPPELNTALGNDVLLLRSQEEPTHIYEIGLDGGNLRQITEHPYWSDLEPTYAADGRIVFSSDRSGRSSECGKFSADHTVINIYSADPDGSNIRRLSDNKDIDRYPHSLNNGLIGYTRWEYQERHFLEVHSVWAVRPDGTMADTVFNQHIRAPYGLRDTRSIPGTNKLVSIATGHHTFAYGPVVVIDPGRGANSPAGIQSVTPHSLPQEGPPPGAAVRSGGVPDRGGLYQTPWAVSESCFLVSYSPALPASGTQGDNNATGFAVYLIDVHGNKELIHRDLIYSSSFPMPLKKRPRPTVLPDLADETSRSATCLVGDVYRGMEGIQRGTVKHIRISQRVGWPLDDQIGAMRYIPGNAWERHFGFWAWAPVRVIGTVPVEPDGSAHFSVPADTAVYFQALDERRMEVRRMRSHISFQAGEVRGCLGCHEARPKTPAADWSLPLAARRDLSVPEAPSWGSRRLLGYEWLIQPILDRHCVECHGGESPDGGIDLASTPNDDGFFRSFAALFGDAKPSSGTQLPLVSVSNRFDGASVSRPMEFGSHESRLARVLLDDELHLDKVKLDSEEWIAIVTWIDANAPYHDTFYNRRPKDGGDPRRNIRIDYPAPFAAASTVHGSR